ncbi:hypothetical protein [Amaricoccus sp.]|uniref:hypothetical protein n=1 Tax=Amaricoccus sp. TaxID=1872485 RepID=UPI001B623402|nr:hypothetical protein [Amaricoccus sp.]MBP7242576.1 hypothetical protein [Amaricoccus sp.]
MSLEKQTQRARARSPLGAVSAAILARPALSRWLLAGPVALAAALATMMAMPSWLPAGRAGVDHLAFPIVLAPLIWAVPFFYACLEENLPRCAATLVGATLVQAIVVAAAIMGD